MESGLISDAQVSASSEYSDLYAATKGRLNNSPKPWVPASSDADQWLKIDVLGMGRKYVRVTGIATQGRYHLTVSHWVTKYKVKYSDDDVNLNRVKPLKIAAARTSRLLKFLILVSSISSARICLLINRWL